MRKWKTILFVCILIIFPILFEVCIANWNVSLLHGADKGNHQVDLQNQMRFYDSQSDNGGQIRTYQFNHIDKFVHKLRIEFQTENTADFDLKLNYLNGYDYEESKTENIRLLKEMKSTTIYIDKNVTSFELSTSDLTFSISEVGIQNTPSFNMYRFAMLSMISVFIAVCWYLFKKNKFHLEYIFILLVLMIGSMIIVMLPRVSHWGMDSEIHFKNAYKNSFVGGAYSLNRSYTIAIELPLISKPSTIEDNKAMNEILNHEQNAIVQSYESKNILPAYNELGYLPYSVGLAIGRMLQLPFTLCFMLGKFMNLLIYTVLGFFTLKCATKGKRLFFTLLLIPSMMFTTAYYSLDGMIFACMMLSFSLFFNQYFDKQKKISFGWTLAFIIASCTAGLSKAVYCLVVLLPFLFSKDKFKNQKQMWVFKIGLGLISFVLLSSMLLPIISGSSGPSDIRGGLTSSSEQIKSLLTHPISFIEQFSMILLNSLSIDLLADGTYGLFGYIGQLNGTVVLIEMLLLLFLSLTDWDITEKIKIKHKVFWAFMLSLLILMIYGAMYLSFTPVGLSSVNGVQPRYFLHVLPLFFILLANPSIKHYFNNKRVNLGVVAIVASISFISVYSMILRVFCN